ncbi:hypothetical protein GCM10027169_15930 [Gordonia jinhuaensis]|uniref:Helix-turn-helix domain-containing protein n=1 Tax=Gordonia jinhuaensis TaxID=1517702 RepID=A0A916X229_9ACTN|nr:hypothetical protein GCM10011489_39870 [Gordonia jinhuaensis]
MSSTNTSRKNDASNGLVKLSKLLEMVPITRPTAISLIRSGEIRGKRIGRGWFIPQSEVDRLTNT